MYRRRWREETGAAVPAPASRSTDMMARRAMRIGLVAAASCHVGSPGGQAYARVLTRCNPPDISGACPARHPEKARRIHPLPSPDWTLICDEHPPPTRSKVCNVTQTLLDRRRRYRLQLVAGGQRGRQADLHPSRRPLRRHGRCHQHSATRRPGPWPASRSGPATIRVCVATMRPSALMFEQIDRASLLAVSFEDGHMTGLEGAVCWA